MSAPPRLKLNTTLAGVYLTTLTDADIQDLKRRLENFNFEVLPNQTKMFEPLDAQDLFIFRCRRPSA